MALNIHVLPQAGVVIGVLGSTEAPVEVHRHANQVVAPPAWPANNQASAPGPAFTICGTPPPR
jgi:hypothetical protein